MISNQQENELENFMQMYWNARLGDDPCASSPIGRIAGRATVGEQIPNYRFSYNDAVISRRSFRGFLDDPCDNRNIITGSQLEVGRGEEIIVVIGSSLFTPYGQEIQATPDQLVRQEMDAVTSDSISVTINGVEQIPRGNINSLRVGPSPFDLIVHQNNQVAERMEYPLETGRTYAGSSTGGHCLVLKAPDKSGSYEIRANFAGVRSYSNNVGATLVVS